MKKKSYLKLPCYYKLPSESKAILYELGAKLGPVLNYYLRSLPDITDHGDKHSLRLIGYLNQIFSTKMNFTEKERFVLYLAAWLHDLGCINTRKYHNLESERMICENSSLKELLEKIPEREKKALRQVIVNHAGKFNEEGMINDVDLDVKKISAVFRFVDACDISESRAPASILDFLEDMPTNDLAYWLAHPMISVNISPQKNNVTVIIYLEKIRLQHTRLSRKNIAMLLARERCLELVELVKKESERVNKIVKGTKISLKIIGC